MWDPETYTLYVEGQHWWKGDFVWILIFSGSKNKIHNDESSPFFKMTFVTLPARENLWILKEVGVLMSLYVFCIFLTWVWDNWVPLQWGRHQWCYCSQTHKGSVACGILGKDWPGLHLLFAGTDTHRTNYKNTEAYRQIHWALLSPSSYIEIFVLLCKTAYW